MICSVEIMTEVGRGLLLNVLDKFLPHYPLELFRWKPLFSAGSKIYSTVSAEVIYDGQSLQVAKISGLAEVKFKTGIKLTR